MLFRSSAKAKPYEDQIKKLKGEIEDIQKELKTVPLGIRGATDRMNLNKEIEKRKNQIKEADPDTDEQLKFIVYLFIQDGY